jgi:hypothetical protein
VLLPCLACQSGSFDAVLCCKQLCKQLLARCRCSTWISRAEDRCLCLCSSGSWVRSADWHAGCTGELAVAATPGCSLVHLSAYLPDKSGMNMWGIRCHRCTCQTRPHGHGLCGTFEVSLTQHAASLQTMFTDVYQQVIENILCADAIPAQNSLLPLGCRT